jgi:hypothetical protein
MPPRGRPGQGLGQGAALLQAEVGGEVDHTAFKPAAGLGLDQLGFR